MSTLATIERRDGVTAELRPGYLWYSADRVWAEVLNARFDPTLDRRRGIGGMPGYVNTVADAAREYECTARYPWTDTPARKGVVY